MLLHRRSYGVEGIMSRITDGPFAIKAQKLWLTERCTEKKNSSNRTQTPDSSPESSVTGYKNREHAKTAREAYDYVDRETKDLKAVKNGNRQTNKNKLFCGTSTRYCEGRGYTRTQSARRGSPLTVNAVGYHADKTNHARTRSCSLHMTRDVNKAENFRPISSSKSETYGFVRLSSSLTNLSKISATDDLNSVLQVSHCRLSPRWAIDTSAFGKLKETLKKRRAQTALPSGNRVKLQLNIAHNFTRQTTDQTDVEPSQMKRSSSVRDSPTQRKTNSRCQSQVAKCWEGMTSFQGEPSEDPDFHTNSTHDLSMVPTAQFVDFSEAVHHDGHKNRSRLVKVCRPCYKDSSTKAERECHSHEPRDHYRHLLRPNVSEETLPQMVVYQWAEQTASSLPRTRRRSHTVPSLHQSYKRVIEIDLRGIPRCTSSERMPCAPPSSPKNTDQDEWTDKIELDN